jgi:hypothetical protein
VDKHQVQAHALFESNKATMGHFKVGQNVVLHPQPARLDNKSYGTIVGFELNAIGEVILVIQVAKHGGSEVQKCHPLNRLTVVELV